MIPSFPLNLGKVDRELLTRNVSEMTRYEQNKLRVSRSLEKYDQDNNLGWETMFCMLYSWIPKKSRESGVVFLGCGFVCGMRGRKWRNSARWLTYTFRAFIPQKPSLPLPRV